MNCNAFPEESAVLRELKILKSQDEMAQILILNFNEIENDNKTNESEEFFNLINLKDSHFPH